MALAAVTLVGASAFAESRPSEGTRSRGDARATVRRGTVSARGEVGRGNESRNRATIDRRSTRSTERRSVEPRATTRRAEPRTYERRANPGNDSRRRNESYRRSDRNRGGDSRGGYNRGDRGYGNGGYGNRGYGNRGYSNRGGYRYNHHYGRPYYHHGRISNFHRYGGGYRVWIVGAPYPFYVPLAYWRADRFRIGLSIGLGGYYNSAGYYDYYDGYRDGYRDSYRRDRYSEADFRGVVESVDWRRDTFVVRNEATGNFITVVLRDRREENVRPGDYVEVRGDWTTRGYFHAYDVDLLD